MHIRPKTQTQINQVLAITLFWILCGALLAVYKCVTYDLVSERFIFIVPEHLPLGSFILVNIIGPAFGGVVGGGILVLVLNEKLRNRSYRYYLAVNILFFFVFIFTLNTVVSYFFFYEDQILSNNHKLQEAIRLLVLDPYAIRNIVTWLIIAFFTLQGMKIYEKYGPGTLLSMFLGKFHRPHEVERVFMFLDLSDSTSLAEQLGHLHFFSLLHDFYLDITDPILNSRGDIYQYVGDEVVISWPPQKAVTKDPNCIDCFFRIEETIAQREWHYRQKYGVVPTFKAAVHKGAVVVGEMGVIKREIVYSGDILNTTSRMMEQCKKRHQKLIISRDIVDMVSNFKLRDYTLDAMGDMSLRGKTQMVELFGVRKIRQPSSCPEAHINRD